MGLPGLQQHDAPVVRIVFLAAINPSRIGCLGRAKGISLVEYVPLAEGVVDDKKFRSRKRARGQKRDALAGVLLSWSGHSVVEQDLLRCLGVPGWRGPPDALEVPREVALIGEANAGSGVRRWNPRSQQLTRALDADMDLVRVRWHPYVPSKSVREMEAA